MWCPSSSVVLLFILYQVTGQMVTTRSEMTALYRASGAQVWHIQSPSLPPKANRDRPNGRSSTTTTSCGYTILAARGTGENQTDPNGSKALISRVLGTVMGGDAYDVLYPATFNFATDPEVGASDLLSHVTLLQSRCRGRKLVLYGYCGSLLSCSSIVID